MKTKLEKEIKDLESQIHRLDKLKNDIVSIIDNFNEIRKKEIQYLKMILFNEQFQKSQNNLNFFVRNNIYNYVNSTNSNKIELFEKIYSEGNKYISLISNIKNVQFTCYKKIKKSNPIYYINVLKDGSIVSCSLYLDIYNKDSLDIQLSINDYSYYSIYSFTELEDGRIIVCSSNSQMYIIKLLENNKYQIEQYLKGHIYYVYKVIEIKKNELISISYDKKMKIWKPNTLNQFECIKDIDFMNNNGSCDILKLNENECVTSLSAENCLKFWNTDYSNIATLSNIVNGSETRQNLCLIENDILCVGGGSSTKRFYLIKISTHQLIKTISILSTIYAVYKCLDGSLLCSVTDKNGYYSIEKYQYSQQNLNLIYSKEKAHDGYIYTCIELKDKTIITGSSDYYIKCWYE